jgi:SAM-dependent methyltransferase
MWKEEVDPVDTQALWLALLECQTSLTLPLEMPFYYESPDWMNAALVLDLGTGPGYHCNQLAATFPEKAFVGVDQDAEFVRIARRHAAPTTEFVHRDLFDMSGTYPFIVSRLVAQHLPSLPAFLAKVHDLLEPGGCFLSIEPNDLLRRYHPMLPTVQSVFAAYTRSRSNLGFDGDAGLTMCALAPTSGFHLLRWADMIVPSSIPGYKELFGQFNGLALRLLEEVFGVDVHRADVDEELESWLRDDRSYGQLAVRVALYRRL